ncbi:MAG: hypothetical protein ACFB2X_06280 [Rivularia sp. (in: cyanobacteria)]
MLKSIALTSGLIVASAIAMENAAFAQSVDVPFSGTVPIQATFTSPTPGEVQPVVSSGSGSTKRFESQTPAKMTVQTTSDATITVSAPRLVSGPNQDPVGTKRTAFLKFGSTSVSSNTNGGSAKLPAGKTDVEVNLLVERPQAFQRGKYTYVVNLTLTP